MAIVRIDPAGRKVADVLSAITLRMSGHYLPLATIAWALSLYYLMSNLDFLGKYDGILGVPPITLAGISLGTAVEQRGITLLSGSCDDVVDVSPALDLAGRRGGRHERAVRAARRCKRH